MVIGQGCGEDQGARPETKEAGVRVILGRYGGILNAKKGLISSIPECCQVVPMVSGELSVC